MSGVLPLFSRSLRESWRSTVGWSLGVAAAMFMYLPLFPSLGGNPDVQELLDSLPEEMVRAIGYQSLTTGAGYTQSTFYGLIGFALLVIAATSWATAAIAGDEENGSLELTLGHAISRTQVVLERTAAVVLRLAWLGLLSALLVLALNDSAGLGIDPAHALAGAGAIVGIASLVAAAGIAVGAITGRRVYASGAAAGVAVLAYAFNAIGNQGEELEWLHALSPYHWAYGNTPLSDGADWSGLGLLYGVTAVLVGVAVVALNKRDIAG